MDTHRIACSLPSGSRPKRAAAFCLLLALLTLGLTCVASADSDSSLGDSSSGATPTLTTLHTFSPLVQALNADGAQPFAGLVQGQDGDFYGTASSGGAYGYGTIFKITSSGTFVVVHSFSTEDVNGDNADGADPHAALIVGRDGNLYGTTHDGGAHGNGTVFQMTPTGTVTALHSFSSTNVNNANADGAYPEATLVQGSDGSFYGTTNLGGVNGVGTIFKVTSTGSFTTLLSFSATNVPYYTAPSPLVEGNDGSFYGTTGNGGTSSVGTVFKITSAGVFSVLHNFSSTNNTGFNTDGDNPLSGMILGNDGNLYGTTGGAGPSGNGTIFKITPGGTLTTLYAFSGASDGSVPATNLILGSDGNFYGTTYGGGSGNVGTIFEFTPTGSLTTLFNFDGSIYGSHPSSLFEGSDGKLYGTTSMGGVNGSGTVFQFSVPGLESAPTWTATAVSAAPSGISHILWTRSDGAAGLWTLNATGVQTAYGPTYGPYPGWTATAVATANDGTSRVLWTNTNGQAGVWTFNASDTETTIGTTYGPYTGWSAKAVGVAGDGTSRVLWTNTNGMAGVWSFNTADVETIVGKTYGPYPGWSAQSLAADPSGASRVLWDNANGQAGVWTFNASDAETVVGMTYGPYPGWTAKAVGAAGDGTARVLWTNANGAAGVWSFNASDAETLIGKTYGPYAGYTATALGVPADGTSRILWDNASRAAGVWSLGTNDAQSVVGSVYGPY